MLVLSRKINEKIVIDGGIVLTVVKIDLAGPGSGSRPGVRGLP